MGKSLKKVYEDFLTFFCDFFWGFCRHLFCDFFQRCAGFFWVVYPSNNISHVMKFENTVCCERSLIQGTIRVTSVARLEIPYYDRTKWTKRYCRNYPQQQCTFLKIDWFDLVFIHLFHDNYFAVISIVLCNYILSL